MTTETAKLLENLPTILKADEVRQFLHISRRKCAWFLQSGLIKCTISKNKTRNKYIITRDDLGEFIDDFRLHPEKYATPFAEFSAAKYNPVPPIKVRFGFPNELPADFADWLEDEFASLPDAFTAAELMEVTGYTDNAIQRWLANGHLRSVETQSGVIVAKPWLVEFYCGYGYRIAKMSERHVGMMERYFRGS